MRQELKKHFIDKLIASQENMPREVTTQLKTDKLHDLNLRAFYLKKSIIMPSDLV